MDTGADEQLRRALELGYAYLNRRDRTESEVRLQLERKGVSAELTEAALRTLSEQALLDDTRFARLFVSDKRELEQWGNERIMRGLLARGIDRELAAAALEVEAADHEDGGDGELQRALALLHRRFPRPPGTAASASARWASCCARATRASWRSMPWRRTPAATEPPRRLTARAGWIAAPADRPRRLTGREAARPGATGRSRSPCCGCYESVAPLSARYYDAASERTVRTTAKYQQISRYRGQRSSVLTPIYGGPVNRSRSVSDLPS